MLASARERHPRQSVGHIRLLSSPFRPGGGGEGLGERGGMNKTLEFLQFGPARPLMTFIPLALIGLGQEATETVAILAPKTPRSPRRAGKEGHQPGGAACGKGVGPFSTQ